MVVHDALAVLTYDAAAQQYAFRAYQGSGGAASAVDAAASLVDGALVWGFKAEPRRPAQYPLHDHTVGGGGEVG